MEYNSNKNNKNFYEKDIEQYQQQQQNEEFLNSTFNKLYHSINPSCPMNYILPQNFQNLLRRILSTNFSVMKNDESAIINNLLDKVSKSSNFNQEVINRFQYLYSKLTKKRALTKRWGILYILNALSKKNNLKDISFSGTNELQQNYMNMPNSMIIDKDYLFNNSNNKFHGNTIGIDSNNYFNKLSPISNVNERFYDNQNLINYNGINNIQEPIIVVNPNKTSLKITEKDIINDLLFVFEGINGKYIAYDASKDAYILNKLIPWNEDIYNIVNSLCEIGWLYKKIKLYLDYFKESNIQSQYIKSFIYSIQNELNDYFKLISFFRKLNSNQNQNINIEKRSQNLNLKNIILWTLIPKETLKWIAACCEALHSLKGTSVLSQIYSFVHYGGCNDCLNNILNEVSKPFINFVINWIKYGELQDSNKEFFVDILTGIKDDDIWNLQYQLIGKNVPNFMKREPTIKIFEVGKCIHFIRNYCNENYNLSNLKIILINLIKKCSKLNREKEEKNIINTNNQMDLEESDINMNLIMNVKEDNQISNKRNNKNNFDKFNFDYGFDEDKIMFEIESYQSCLDFIDYIFDPSKQEEILNMSFINEIIFNIDVIHKLINKDLVRIIFTKFKFLTNLDSINKYLLLGQGDMMQSLMESLFEELDKPANLIFKHNLQSNLESSIRASNAQYNDPDCLKKLNIKLINASVGDVGWDIFCLEYKVDLPLTVIFNSKLLKDYQKLFFFFWKIKRIEYSQNNHIWKKVKTFNQLLKNKLDFMKKPIKISIHFNQEIIHFITNLHNYLALEVLETQYKKLLNELPKVNNLDELINKHRQFVDNIKKQCLLNEENITINKKINNIFDIILRFRTIHDALYNFLVEQSYENSNDMGGNNSYINQNRLKNIKEYLQQIAILYKDFQNQIIELINTIDLLGKNNLEYLKVKLDFNYYYSFLEKEEEERKNMEAINKINAEEERKKILSGSISDNDNYSNSNDNIHYGNNYKNNYGNNINNNLGNSDEDHENAGDEEMEIDDNNNIINNNNRNFRFQNLESNNDQSLQESNNFNSSNNNILNDFDNKNNLENSNMSDKNNFENKKFENSNNIFGKSSKYYSSNNNNNNIGKMDNNDNLNDNLGNINNISGIKTSKDNNFKIITKKKENKPNDKNNDLKNISDFNKYYNKNINNDSNNILNKNDLNEEEDEDDKDLNYNNNNYVHKTQDIPKTYQYEKNKNNMQSGLTYNFKTMTKNKPEINLNLENVDDEDQITTDIKPKIYGISRAKRNDDNQ